MANIQYGCPYHDSRILTEITLFVTAFECSIQTKECTTDSVKVTHFQFHSSYYQGLSQSDASSQVHNLLETFKQNFPLTASVLKS